MGNARSITQQSMEGCSTEQLATALRLLRCCLYLHQLRARPTAAHQRGRRAHCFARGRLTTLGARRSTPCEALMEPASGLLPVTLCAPALACVGWVPPLSASATQKNSRHPSVPPRCTDTVPSLATQAFSPCSSTSKVAWRRTLRASRRALSRLAPRPSHALPLRHRWSRPPPCPPRGAKTTAWRARRPPCVSVALTRLPPRADCLPPLAPRPLHERQRLRLLAPVRSQPHARLPFFQQVRGVQGWPHSASEARPPHAPGRVGAGLSVQALGSGH